MKHRGQERVARVSHPRGTEVAQVSARVGLAAAIKMRDWALAESVLMKYGYYLELTDPLHNTPTGTGLTFTRSYQVVQ